MVEELRIAGKPNPLDEFHFPWSNSTFDCLKIAGQPNGIDALKIAGTLTDTDALKVVQENQKTTETKASYSKAVNYEKYFGEMEITNEEVKERKDTAKELEKVFLFLFALLLLLREKDVTVNLDVVIELTIMRFREALIQLDIEYSKIKPLVDDITKKITESTKRNFDNKYFTTTDRAKHLAENESNTINNELALQDAISNGFKYKKWLTMKDERVRHTHREVDNIKIAINDKFVVGDCLMRYPHDTEYGDAEEVNGCRCTIEYTNDPTKSEKQSNESQ